MAQVTETLLDLLRKQIETHGAVVWYDPEEAYLDLAWSLEPEMVAGAAIHRYEPERGFIWLRRQVESLWAGQSEPPRLLLYVPLAQAETGHALVEYEVGGVTMQPGQQPPERNTALAAVARRALEGSRPPAALDQILAEVEAGKWSLAELDREAERGLAEGVGVLKLIFGTGNASEIALRFVSNPGVDAGIHAKQALPSLAGLLAEALGVPLPIDQGTAGLRASLARQVLVTDLIEALGEDMPPALSTFSVAPQPAARRAATELARTWRLRRDLAESYVRWAGQIQAEIGLRTLDMKLAALARTETFGAGETRLQELVEAALVQRASAHLLELARARLGGFWSAQKPEIKTRWEVIADAGRVLVEAARIESALKGKTWPAEALLSHYAWGDEPWCELDTAQRHLERDFHRFELNPRVHGSLIQLAARARQRYAAVSDDLAERFTRAYAADQFHLPNVLLQADVYHASVAPATKSERVAYILVDALRFEMARELCGILEEDCLPAPPRGSLPWPSGQGVGERAWKSDLTLALATPPAITEIGMAALLPGAEQGLTVVSTGDGKLAAVVAGQTLKTRQERVDYFKKVVGGDVAVARLDQLAPLSDTHLSQDLKSAPVVLVTAAEEIDGLCESNPALARRMLDDVLNQLRRGLKTLFSLGIQTAIISADHGYLFGEKLTPGEKIDAPGGKPALLKRRAWVGQGGAHSPGILRASLSAFGLGGELGLATPWNLACFKAKGGDEYFHGGLSLPELVIPVLSVRPGAVPAPEAAAQIQWTLRPGSRTISTRFFSVTIEGHSTELLPLEPPAVRVEVRAGEQPISVPISASYGFQEATRDVQLALATGEPGATAPNTVTLMITETPPVDEVTVHLLDATTGVSLARLEHVPFAITL
jgi:hypothetical protein